MNEKIDKLNENTMVNVLDDCYKKALVGLPTSESVDMLAYNYIQKYPDPKTAAKKLVTMQIAKCGTSGFVTNLGGVITFPVAVPVNIASILYVQLRMIAAIARIGGYDPSDDEVQTMAYVCLTGSAAVDIVKKAGINIGEKITMSALKKLPGKVLTRINQKVGFRLLTKFGEKGAINLVKTVPLVGGVIGGGIDVISTRTIAKTAMKMFLGTDSGFHDEGLEL